MKNVTNQKKPLIITIGNEARGDDGIGYVIFEQLQTNSQLPQIDSIHVTQLQPEHVELLQQRKSVLFIDAAQQQTNQIELKPLIPNFNSFVSSHIVPPEVLIGWYQELMGEPVPNCQLLTLRGEQFELGESLSATAQQAIPELLNQVKNWINQISS